MAKFVSRARAVVAVVLAGPRRLGLRLQHRFRPWRSRPRRNGRTCRTTISAAPTSFPNLVATVQGYAKQEKDVLTAVIEARAKATQVQGRRLAADRSGEAQAVPGRAEPALRRARPADRGQRELSRPQVEPELPRAAVAARGHREPHRRRPARLHRGGAGLQHRAEDLPRRAVGRDLLPLQQADGGVRRRRGCADAAASEVLTRPT